MFTVGSLFSGIGGIELGLQWAGISPVIWLVEINEHCQSVLKKHFPGAKLYADVKKVGKGNLEPVDLICGGYPCQELSGASAKKGPGLLGERSGLWFEYSRIISELRPRWVVIENVRSGANRWVDEIMEGLAKHRYESLPIPISAFDVGAPHLRQRVFIIARNVDAHGNIKPMVQKYEKMARLQESPRDLSCWSRPPRIRVADGISKKMAAYGNAVVPQCAEVIGNIIKEIEKKNDTNTLWKR